MKLDITEARNMRTPLSEISENARGTTFGARGSFADTRIVRPARVQIRDGFLEWSGDAGIAVDQRRGTIDDACLRRFMRLVDAPSQEIAKFAQRYGVLYLGENGRPVSRGARLPAIEDDRPPQIGPPVGSTGEPIITRCNWSREPIAGWRAWSRYIRAVLVLCHELRHVAPDGKPINPWYRLRNGGFDLSSKGLGVVDESQIIERVRPAIVGFYGPKVAAVVGYGSQETFDDSLWTDRWIDQLEYTVHWELSPWRLIYALTGIQSASEQGRLLMLDVNHLLFSHRRYKIRLEWDKDGPRPRLDPSHAEQILTTSVHNALSTIAAQLIATIIAGGKNIQICADCNVPYVVKRRRQNGRCPECGKAERSASTQRSRAKEKAREASASTPITTPKPANGDGSPRTE